MYAFTGYIATAHILSCRDFVDFVDKNDPVLLHEGECLLRQFIVVEQLVGQRHEGVTLLGLAALDEEATPRYDRRVGAMLADRGMHIAALTPDRFAEWLAEVMS